MCGSLQLESMVFYYPFVYIGVTDSSGMRIWYTSSPREYDAGMLAVGYSVTPHMVVPPNAKNFTITGFVHEECTNRVSLIINHTFHGYSLYLFFFSTFLRMAFMCLQISFTHILLVSIIAFYVQYHRVWWFLV